MTEDTESGTLPDHLSRLAADADALREMLTAQHRDGGDIHPEALPKAEHLVTSLHEVVDALTHHEHLAITADDVWRALTLKHAEHDDQPLT